MILGHTDPQMDHSMTL